MTNQEKQPNYLVIDNYGFAMEQLGKVNTMREVKALCKERVEDTDGECCVLVLKRNPETNKYSRKSAEVVYY